MEEILKYFNRIEYDPDDQIIWDVDKLNQITLVAELRGWGNIQNYINEKTGKFNQEKAAEFQDKIGFFIQDAINEKIEREKVNLNLK